MAAGLPDFLEFEHRPMWLKYADHEIRRRAPIVHEQIPYLTTYAKPRGSWITDDSGHNWRAWCEAEQRDLDRLQYAHEVVLNERDILFVRSAAELDAFTRRWGGTDVIVPENGQAIDWSSLAKAYDGIVIAPFISVREPDHETNWYYYCWEFASGCIWNERAILEIKPLT